MAQNLIGYHGLRCLFWSIVAQKYLPGQRFPPGRNQTIKENKLPGKFAPGKAMKLIVADTTIQIQQGDICEADAEAIVNAANNYLWMGGGVAGAIRRKGGEEIEQEALALGPIAVGEAVVTGGGRLRAKYVIHAAGMGQDLQTDAEKVGLATRNSLLRAKELGLQSIAFPAIGTGVGGFSKEQAAAVMLAETMAHIKAGTPLKTIIFCLFDDATRRTFEAEISREKEQISQKSAN
jgi:O-acetyl-ADP-ribose deacetylase (regulator of RNase III)